MKYVTKPEYIEAFQIRDVCPPLPDGSCMLYLEDGKTATAETNEDEIPSIGDYWIVDGPHQYWGIGRWFKDKYQPVLAEKP